MLASSSSLDCQAAIPLSSNVPVEKKEDFLDAEFIIEPHISEFLSQYNSSGRACIKNIVIVILNKNILKIYQRRNESHINQYYTYTTPSTFILLY